MKPVCHWHNVSSRLPDACSEQKESFVAETARFAGWVVHMTPEEQKTEIRIAPNFVADQIFVVLRKRLSAKDALSHKWLLEHVKDSCQEVRCFVGNFGKTEKHTIFNFAQKSLVYIY
jgi:hypothetical protein